MKVLPIVLGSLLFLTIAPRGLSLEKNIYGFEAKSISGAVVRMQDYAGKVLLIVNTASGCGYTPQYAGLADIYKKYKDRGFVVLGFPSNDFGRQEPKSNEEIKKFCELRYKVDFPLFAKSVVSGPDKIPLYRHLTAADGGEVAWNFEKFLIDRDGRVAARFNSQVEPQSAEISIKIETLLATPSGKK